MQVVNYSHVVSTNQSNVFLPHLLYKNSCDSNKICLDLFSSILDKNSLEEKLKFVKYLPGFIFIKDSSFKFMGMSDSFAQFVGWKDAEHAVGKTDYQVPCKASEYADRFQSDDSKVINSNTKVLNLEIYDFATGWKSTIVQKVPLRDNRGKIIATFCQLFDISNSNMLKCFKKLNSNDQKLINSFKKPSTYILNPERCPLPLSPRQQECVFLLVRGKTIKEIGYILGLSGRTIETYIEHIKYKLGCYTKGQIIEKAIDSGFLYYIPEAFM